MVEEILPNLYKIEVPLPHNPLKAINSYVIRAGEQSLIIDTGMNRKECKDVLLAGLEELGVDLQKTDYFITHLHADHLGLVSSLVTDKSIVYFNQPDADWINSRT
ncbi:MAG: MBL fold metallo-hydrolase, partial [Dehalococcoidales bacterium]|nr:MBL fold metallo-hydrolase [Dehalococcoidales bacterium]